MSASNRLDAVVRQEQNMTDWICKKTGQPCQTKSMCAPYGGCATEAPTEKVVTWVALFIGTGLEMGIQPRQMMKALTPKKLEQIIEVLNKDA